jgi:hypothetical protein
MYMEKWQQLIQRKGAKTQSKRNENRINKNKLCPSLRLCAFALNQQLSKDKFRIQ